MNFRRRKLNKIKIKSFISSLKRIIEPESITDFKSEFHNSQQISAFRYNLSVYVNTDRKIM